MIPIIIIIFFIENQTTVIQVQLLHFIVMMLNCSVLKKNKIQIMSLYIEWILFKFEDQKLVLQEIDVDFL